MTSPATIAAGLSEEERAALRSARNGFVTGQNDAVKPVWELRDRGLLSFLRSEHGIFKSTWEYSLTPLGRAVAAALQEQKP